MRTPLPTKNSDAVLDRLTRLHPKVIDLVLSRIELLLARLGNPEWRLPPVVHVAGTNGKGSVIAFLRAIIEAAGYRVHVYTSPHLARFHERIRLAGTLIAETDLLAVLAECEAANGEAPITFFEITTAAAFLAFTRTPADIVLLETGLGGRLDATNVIKLPFLTAITPVDLDHQGYLGETLSEIAGEKAGILKPGVPCVLAMQRAEADAVITNRAAAVGAPLMRHGVDWRGTLDLEGGTTFHFQGADISLPRPGLVGTHQIGNASHAIACARMLPGFDISDSALARGLREVVWPARLQLLTAGPLVAAIPEGWEVWLDGGHNAGAARALASQAETWSDRPLYLIVGMLNNRDPALFLEPLMLHARVMRAVPITTAHAGREATTIAEAATGLGMSAATAHDAYTALVDIIAEASAPSRVLVCGSLYLAGALIAEGNS
jgi:dihydrofolate synthase/folylpolyglutamate synthase